MRVGGGWGRGWAGERIGRGGIGWEMEWVWEEVVGGGEDKS